MCKKADGVAIKSIVHKFNLNKKFIAGFLKIAFEFPPTGGLVKGLNVRTSKVKENKDKSSIGAE